MWTRPNILTCGLVLTREQVVLSPVSVRLAAVSSAASSVTRGGTLVSARGAVGEGGGVPTTPHTHTGRGAKHRPPREAPTTQTARSSPGLTWAFCCRRTACVRPAAAPPLLSAPEETLLGPVLSTAEDPVLRPVLSPAPSRPGRLRSRRHMGSSAGVDILGLWEETAPATSVTMIRSNGADWTGVDE